MTEVYHCLYFFLRFRQILVELIFCLNAHFSELFMVPKSSFFVGTISRVYIHISGTRSRKIGEQVK